MTDDVEDFARRLIATLDQVGVSYMVAGSFASTYHGLPRTTHDLDLFERSIQPREASHLGGIERLLAVLTRVASDLAGVGATAPWFRRADARSSRSTRQISEESNDSSRF